MKITFADSKVALVYGQMNEPPGARMRVGLSALTMAEYFRDVNKQDVLLFIDNIFRFTQAGSEVSALLGRMPSAVGYQPTLATEMGAFTRTYYINNTRFNYIYSSSLCTCRRFNRSSSSNYICSLRCNNSIITVI